MFKYFLVILKPIGVPGSACQDNQVWIIAFDLWVKEYKFKFSVSMLFNVDVTIGSNLSSLGTKNDIKSSSIPFKLLFGIIQTPTLTLLLRAIEPSNGISFGKINPCTSNIDFRELHLFFRLVSASIIIPMVVISACLNLIGICSFRFVIPSQSITSKVSAIAYSDPAAPEDYSSGAAVSFTLSQWSDQ